MPPLLPEQLLPSTWALCLLQSTPASRLSILPGRWINSHIVSKGHVFCFSFKYNEQKELNSNKCLGVFTAKETKALHPFHVCRHWRRRLKLIYSCHTNPNQHTHWDLLRNIAYGVWPHDFLYLLQPHFILFPLYKNTIWCFYLAFFVYLSKNKKITYN